MNKLGIFFIIILIFTTSCADNKRDAQLQSEILGTWRVINIVNEKEPPLIPSVYPFYLADKKGFTFKENGICENKHGFFKSSSSKVVVFDGTETKYKIENRVLKIYNRQLDRWISNSIVKLTYDTLYMAEYEGIIPIYVRVKEVAEPLPFDDIIVSQSGCYGTCPMNDIYVKKNGEMLFWGYEHNLVNGFYRANIEPQLIDSLYNAFKYVDILTLQENYTINATDLSTTTVSFIKDGQIIKTVQDYGFQSPAEFQ